MSTPLRVGDAEALSRISLFENLTPGDLHQVAKFLHRRTCVRGTTLMVQGQPGEALYIVLRGAVKVCAQRPDGADVILAICSVGEILGEISFLDGRGHSASVVTLQESELLWIDYTSLTRCLMDMPLLSLNLARLVAQRLRRLSKQTEAVSALNVMGRVAYELLSLTTQHGEVLHNGDTVIRLRLTQSDLADMSGCSRMQVNRVISCLQQEQAICFDQAHRIVICNPAILSRHCAGSSSCSD